MKCANHPLNDALSYCGQCGKSLCTECKRDVSGMVYCESCLASRLHSPLPPWGGVGAGPSPGVALALGFIPGVGAIYNGQIAKAISQVLIFGCLFYFYMVIDSFQTAKAKTTGQPVPEWFGLNEMKLNAPIGAALLIGLGVLFLLDNLGVPVINQLSKFWPVLLIVAGFLILQRRFAGGTPPQTPAGTTQIEKHSDGPSNIPGPKGM